LAVTWWLHASGATGNARFVPRIGVVLGAGGVTGDAFHRGVLRAALDHGYDAAAADVLVGTSAGSYVAASLRRPAARRGTTTRDTVHTVALGRRPAWSALLATARRPWQARAGVVASSLLPTGRRSTDFLVSAARAHHGAQWPDQPLYVCAVRRRDGRRVVFGRPGAPVTDVARAVAASCAIPGYFHPVEIDGEAYVDGGVHSPTNADVLRDERLDVVLVSSPMSVDVRALRATVDLVPRLHAHHYLRREVAMLRRRGTVVATFEPGADLLRVMGVNPMHGARIDEIEAMAHERAATVFRADPDLLRRLRGAAGAAA
jgi:NTE family protein